MDSAESGVPFHSAELAHYQNFARALVWVFSSLHLSFGLLAREPPEQSSHHIEQGLYPIVFRNPACTLICTRQVSHFTLATWDAGDPRKVGLIRGSRAGLPDVHDPPVLARPMQRRLTVVSVFWRSTYLF